MKRDDYLNSIAKNFGRLTHEMRSLNAIGRFDINSVAEDFLVPIIKITFGCSDLKNQNEIQVNFPAVDLGCRTTRKCFQVTTNASSEKVEKTLKKFSEHGLEKYFDRVYILALTEKQASYNSKSLTTAVGKLKIPFDKTEHIIDVDSLICKIRLLCTTELEIIDAYMTTGLVKHDTQVKFRAQIDKFLKFSTDKIESEKRTRKYIPAVFVETHHTKEEVRLFAHPLFFYRKIQDRLSKINYEPINSILKIANEPAFDFSLDNALLLEKPSRISELQDWIDRTTKALNYELKKVRPLSWRREEGEQEYSPINGKTANWMIARFQAEILASGLTSSLQKALESIDLIRKKIFLVTSMAGQGKTNFVCDLVENQFRAFEIPCLFIPARELNRYTSGKRLFEYISNNRYSPNVNRMHEYLELFNEIALEGTKPFLIVIDGINEVTDLHSFNEELKDFCSAVCQYDFVKAIITCRSEFFDDKYSSMLSEPFSDDIHRVGDLRSKMNDKSKIRLLKSYFSHFNIKGEFSQIASDFLKEDLLLLRIFCERFENIDIGYMSDIYKGDLFDDYLRMKIELFPPRLKTKALPTLYRIITEMLGKNDFAKLSVRGFTDEEQDIVRRFMDDDVILRQEINVEGLSAIGELTVSFTYDELRDFVVAYKLVRDDSTADAASLDEVLSKLFGGPAYEGVYRYAYLLARKTNNGAAIAACENSPNFSEHFSLNVHLLPPTVQTVADVERVKAFLTDTGVPERLRSVARFLVHRQGSVGLLNITILRDHLNELETTDHFRFVQVLFSHPHDYEHDAWRSRIHEFIQNVAEDGTEGRYWRRGPDWLAFFLHVSSLANWTYRERVSTMFRKSIDASVCRQVVELVRPSRSEKMHALLSDIEFVEEAEQ